MDYKPAIEPPLNIPLNIGVNLEPKKYKFLKCEYHRRANMMVARIAIKFLTFIGEHSLFLTLKDNLILDRDKMHSENNQSYCMILSPPDIAQLKGAKAIFKENQIVVKKLMLTKDSTLRLEFRAAIKNWMTKGDDNGLQTSTETSTINAN